MLKSNFEFHGAGLGFLGIYLLNVLLTMITLGLYGPWAYVSIQKWVCENTTIDGRRLDFRGTGLGFFGTYLLIMLLTGVTFGLYAPWGVCKFLKWQTENTYFADSVQGFPVNPYPQQAVR